MVRFWCLRWANLPWRRCAVCRLTVSARTYEWLSVEGRLVRVNYELLENGCWCATVEGQREAAVGDDQDDALERLLTKLGWRLTGRRSGPRMPRAFTAAMVKPRDW